MNLLYNSLEGSNEEKWVGKKGTGSIVKCREMSF